MLLIYLPKPYPYGNVPLLMFAHLSTNLVTVHVVAPFFVHERW